MRVLHLRNTCGHFGAERCIVSWIGEMSSTDASFHLAVFDHPDPSTAEFYAAARRAGAEVHVLPRSHVRAPSSIATVTALVRRHRIEVIHAHENRSQVIGWLVGGLTATPVVGTVHGYVPSSAKTRRFNRLNRWFLGGRRLAALTVPTRELARSLPGATLVPNAIAGALADTPMAVDSRPDPPHFGVVARLSGEKGVDVFLDTVAGMPPDWRFSVIGEGPAAATLRAHRAADRVEWLGFRADAAERMRAWSALVIPSRSEGLPLTLLEAMAQGVPVIASSVGGVPDAVADGMHGLLVPPDDADRLGAAMHALARDPVGATDRASRARERFRERYTLARVAEALASIYAGVARRRT